MRMTSITEVVTKVEPQEKKPKKDIVDEWAELNKNISKGMIKDPAIRDFLNLSAFTVQLESGTVLGPYRNHDEYERFLSRLMSNLVDNKPILYYDNREPRAYGGSISVEKLDRVVGLHINDGGIDVYVDINEKITNDQERSSTLASELSRAITLRDDNIQDFKSMLKDDILFMDQFKELYAKTVSDSYQRTLIISDAKFLSLVDKGEQLIKSDESIKDIVANMLHNDRELNDLSSNEYLAVAIAADSVLQPYIDNRQLSERSIDQMVAHIAIAGDKVKQDIANQPEIAPAPQASKSKKIYADFDH